MEEFISIDPSGMGKNGLFANKHGVNNEFEWKTITILPFENWTHVYRYIINKIKILKLKKVYLEDIKYTFDKVGLETITTIKLIGAIQLYCMKYNITCITVTSDQVKSRAKWFKELKLIEPNKKGIISKRDQLKIDFCNKTQIKYENKKFYYQNSFINSHERDAIIIYYLGLEKEE